MSAALEGVCEALSLKLVDDAAHARLVAQKIIELTQRGVKDEAKLRVMLRAVAWASSVGTPEL